MNQVTPFLRALGAVVWKDLAAEWRSREMLSAMLVFALLVILIFNCQRGTEGNNRFGPDPKPFSY